MKAKWLGFGEIEIDGERYTRDLVIDGGRIRKRAKQPSKPYRARYGHTPLSVEESLPWRGSRLIVGTGAYGSLPIMDEVSTEARRRGIEIVAVPTPEACQILSSLPDDEICAVLHTTC